MPRWWLWLRKEIVEHIFNFHPVHSVWAAFWPPWVTIREIFEGGVKLMYTPCRSRKFWLTPEVVGIVTRNTRSCLSGMYTTSCYRVPWWSHTEWGLSRCRGDRVRGKKEKWKRRSQCWCSGWVSALCSLLFPFLREFILPQEKHSDCGILARL